MKDEDRHALAAGRGVFLAPLWAFGERSEANEQSAKHANMWRELIEHPVETCTQA